MQTVYIKEKFIFALDSEELSALKIVRLNRASVIFFNHRDGKDYFATRRVAQKILDGTVKYAIIEDVLNPKTMTYNAWLSVPSRF